MLTPEQRYRLEMAKDNTPSTNWFMWMMLAAVLFTWFSANKTPWKECDNIVCVRGYL